jgi:pimeloyl-ACP methyl ester carboxylesterase
MFSFFFQYNPHFITAGFSNGNGPGETMNFARIIVVATWLSIIFFGGTGPPAAAQKEVPRFEPEPCATFEVGDYAPGAVEGTDMTCGFLVVPEQRLEPTDKTIKLGIVIIKSTAENPAAPLVMAQGGPGGSSIELYRGLADPDDRTGQLLRADRDLIAFEQRGTHYSEPFLFCQETFDLNVKLLEQPVSDEEEARLTLEAYNACAQRLKEEGVNLAAFNSFENAHDIADLAQVLGYDQINYYGVSYGTMLGQHLLNLHPELVRSAILDAIVPLDVNAFKLAAQSETRALSQLFAACAADPDCDQYYPNLEQVLFETVDQLNRDPVTLPVSDIETRTGYQAVFDGDGFLGIVHELFYVTPAIPVLPKMIYDAHDGSLDLPQIITGLYAFDRGMAEGMYMSVMCAEDLDYTADELPLDGVPSIIADDERVSTDILNQVCTTWNVPELGPAADAAVTGDIPTLLLSGNFDPITPPPFGDDVAKNLNQRYVVVFPVNGHGALMDGGCADRIARDFLNNPDVEPDGNCAADPNAPAFISPANTLTSPAATLLLRLFNQIFVGFADPQALVPLVQPLIAPLLLLLGLLLFPLVWFVRWIINLVGKKPAEKAWPARLSPWVGLLVVATAVAFFVLMGVQVALVEAEGIFAAVSGLPRSQSWIFLLPWLVGLGAVGMAVLAVVSWLKGYWGILGRLYYSFTALLALLLTVQFINLGLMTVLLS